MESITSELGISKSTHPLKSVTPLSKYLAMILFIVMPFIGAWIGYQNAPLNHMETNVIYISDTITTLPDVDNQASSTSGAEFEGEFSVPDELTLTLLFKTPERKAYYESGITGSSACCTILSFDETTGSYHLVTDRDIMSDKLSPSKKLFAKPSVVEEKEIIEIIDVASGTIVKLVEMAAPNETITSGECGYDGYEFDLSWTDESELTYGVYKTDSLDNCQKDLIEYRQLEV
jgi:hypothetical protein